LLNQSIETATTAICDRVRASRAHGFDRRRGNMVASISARAGEPLWTGQTNLTPIRLSLRQSTRQAKCNPSLGIAKLNVAGMPTGVATSSAAPFVETLRTVQSIAPPPNSIVPLFNTRCRGVARFSTIDLPGRTLADIPDEKARRMGIKGRGSIRGRRPVNMDALPNPTIGFAGNNPRIWD
jgi:hypothetical protein